VRYFFVPIRPHGGIGRRNGLKIRRFLGHASSILAVGTTISQEKEVKAWERNPNTLHLTVY
jgi:hypothetical protein